MTSCGAYSEQIISSCIVIFGRHAKCGGGVRVTLYCTYIGEGMSYTVLYIEGEGKSVLYIEGRVRVTLYCTQRGEGKSYTVLYIEGGG